MATKKLTPKQERFCQEYLVDLNATYAYERTGFAAKNRNVARVLACKLTAKPEIQERISELKQERSERTKVDADYVLNGAKNLFERCMQEIKPDRNPDGSMRLDDDGNVIFKFNATGAASALKLLGDHVNVNAFKAVDADGTPIDLNWQVTVVHAKNPITSKT